ncbi:MAG: hypothetical protein JG765_2356 [Cereibacter sp.]|jgi:hypothetical protein|nr:hypothetical protein [Cereibacter sp.]
MGLATCVGQRYLIELEAGKLKGLLPPLNLPQAKN